MARDHARIRLDIWADEDFTSLSSSAQWLYLRLLSHGRLAYCGVIEWHPGRLAASAADLTANDVEMFAAELEYGHFLIIDRDTDEALVRSFVKHDGLMDKWNLASAVARSFTGVASKPLRGVIAHELNRLQKGFPEYRGWTRDDVKKMLRREPITPADAQEMTLPNPTQSPNERGEQSPKDRPSESPKKRGAA